MFHQNTLASNKIYFDGIKSYAIRYLRSYLACNKNKKGS